MDLDDQTGNGVVKGITHWKGTRLPPVTDSWNLVCDQHPAVHYCHAGQPADPEAHRGQPCMADGCDGKLRPRTSRDQLQWTTA